MNWYKKDDIIDSVKNAFTSKSGFIQYHIWDSEFSILGNYMELH